MVVIAGLVLFTVRGSHWLAAPTLLMSPVYRAFQLYCPAELKVWVNESGTTLLVMLAGGPTTVGVPAHVPDPMKYS